MPQPFSPPSARRVFSVVGLLAFGAPSLLAFGVRFVSTAAAAAVVVREPSRTIINTGEPHVLAAFISLFLITTTTKFESSWSFMFSLSECVFVLLSAKKLVCSSSSQNLNLTCVVKFFVLVRDGCMPQR